MGVFAAMETCTTAGQITTSAFVLQLVLAIAGPTMGFTTAFAIVETVVSAGLSITHAYVRHQHSSGVWLPIIAVFVAMGMARAAKRVNIAANAYQQALLSVSLTVIIAAYACLQTRASARLVITSASAAQCIIPAVALRTMTAYAHVGSRHAARAKTTSVCVSQ